MSSKKNNSKLIVMLEDWDQEIIYSLYEYVDLLYASHINFLVNHVTMEEYEEMQKEIKCGFLDERFSNRVEEGLKYNKFRYLMTSDYKSRNISIADYNDFNKVGNYTVDEDGLHYNPDKLQFPVDCFLSGQRRQITVYTTETYDDVVNYYKELENKKMILKK